MERKTYNNIIMLFDLRTTLIASMLVHLTLAISAIGVHHAYRDRIPGTLCWVVSFASSAAGFGLMILRGMIPDALSIVVANSFVFLGISSLTAGSAAFSGHRFPQKTSIVVAILFIAGHAWYGLVAPSLYHRSLILNCIVIAYSGTASFWLLFPKNGRGNVPKNLPLASVLTIIALIYLARLIVALRFGMRLDWMQASNPDVGGLLMTLILYVSIGLTYLRRMDLIVLENIQETARENDLLLRELNHRTKNTLGLISSLISLQADKLIEPATVLAFQELKERVRTVTTVYKLLSREKKTSAADAGEYLKTLAAGLSESFALKKRGISLTATSDCFMLPEDNLIHLGLIANELMTNAIKYAFPGDRNGSIRLSMKARGSDYILEVSDNGVGLPDPDKTGDHPKTSAYANAIDHGLGLTLVNALTEQLHGKLETGISPEGGAAFVFSFPRPEFPAARV